MDLLNNITNYVANVIERVRQAIVLARASSCTVEVACPIPDINEIGRARQAMASSANFIYGRVEAKVLKVT